MNFFKLALVMAFLVLFALACNNTTNTNQASNTGNSQTTTPAATPAAKQSSASPTPVADEFAHAGQVYAQNCAICHGDSARGGIVNIDGKKLKVPSLVEGHALKHTDESVTKRIANGGDGMPAFKDKLKPEEINEMTRYVRLKLQAGAAAPTASAPPAPPKS